MPEESHRIEAGGSASVNPPGQCNRVCYNQAALGRKRNERTEFCKSHAVCPSIPFFCTAGIRGQLCLVAVSAEAAGVFFRWNIWRRVRRGTHYSGALRTNVCTGGAGPPHSFGGTPAVHASVACRSTGEMRRDDDRPSCFAAVRV